MPPAGVWGRSPQGPAGLRRRKKLGFFSAKRHVSEHPRHVRLRQAAARLAVKASACQGRGWYPARIAEMRGQHGGKRDGAGRKSARYLFSDSEDKKKLMSS